MWGAPSGPRYLIGASHFFFSFSKWMLRFGPPGSQSHVGGCKRRPRVTASQHQLRLFPLIFKNKIQQIHLATAATMDSLIDLSESSKALDLSRIRFQLM